MPFQEIVYICINCFLQCLTFVCVQLFWSPSLLRHLYIDSIGQPQEYKLSCKICNVHLEHEKCSLLVTVNDANPQEVRTPYTIGEWGYTNPFDIVLGKDDTLKISRKAGEKDCKFFGLVMKEIILTKPS
jgi:hypothetical protein